jgi:cell division protein FtsB
MIKSILILVFFLSGCIPFTIITGAIGIGDSYRKEVKIEKLQEQVDKLKEDREKRQIDDMIQTK